MATTKGLAVKVEFALTFSAAKTVTAVTVADPAVATSSAHGLANGTVGFFSVTSGMTQLDQQAGRVAATAANTFEVQGLDTSTYTAFTSGTFTPAATWGLLDESISYSIGGGAATSLDDTRLVDVKTRTINGLMGAQTLAINTRAQTFNSSVLAFIEKQARNQAYVLGRITLHDGSTRVFYGQPSMTSEDVQAGALGSGSLSINVPAWVLKTPA
jgi:hypothetical protein